MSLNKNEILELGNRINALFQNPVSGKGHVTDPANDMRLRENQERKEREKFEKQVQDGYQESNEEKTPEKHIEPKMTETERADHRASLDATAAGLTSQIPAGPLVKKPKPMTSQIPDGPLPKQPKASKPKAISTPETRSPEEMALRNHPEFGGYANKAFGPGAANSESIKNLHGKIKNLQSLSSDIIEKNKLQKFASLIAGILLKLS